MPIAMFFYSTTLLQLTEDGPRPLWLTFYDPLEEKSDHGRALAAKRTQVLRNSSYVNDPGTGNLYTYVSDSILHLIMFHDEGVALSGLY